MIIYFAGVPAGLQSKREKTLYKEGIKNRFIAFFYTKKAVITLKYYKRAEISEDDIRRTRDND